MSPSHLQQEIERFAVFGKVISQEVLVKKPMEATPAEVTGRGKEAVDLPPENDGTSELE